MSRRQLKGDQEPVQRERECEEVSHLSRPDLHTLQKTGVKFLFRKQIASGLFQPALTAQEYVGLFYVHQKVVRNDSSSTRDRSMPAKASHNSTWFSPSGATPTASTLRAFTPTALPLWPLLTSRIAFVGCAWTTASVSGSLLRGGKARSGIEWSKSLHVSAHVFSWSLHFAQAINEVKAAEPAPVVQRNTCERLMALYRFRCSRSSVPHTLHPRRQPWHQWNAPMLCGQHVGRTRLSLQRSRATRA